ncbi:transmembrane protein 100 isoform X2 [Dryobates pubescens]|uniref:transmembrane protein 100 isoform X2 n=1 Tax=Dryobates pubescens TaxID=118200 RepID=UPI0023B8EAAA|nr:transmembrane protein 100 isoform X2 [Dryobates pubescens]
MWDPAAPAPLRGAAWAGQAPCSPCPAGSLKSGLPPGTLPKTAGPSPSLVQGAGAASPSYACSGLVPAAVPSGSREETSILEYCHLRFIIQQHLTLQSPEQLSPLRDSALN